MERFKAALFCVIGLALLGGALASALSVRRFVGESAVADGQVVRLNGGGSHPQIAFTTADGRQQSYAQGGFVFGYRVGDRVRVRFRPADPRTTATLDRFGALFFWPLLLALLGGGFLAGGAIGLLAARGS